MREARVREVVRVREIGRERGRWGREKLKRERGKQKEESEVGREGKRKR